MSLIYVLNAPNLHMIPTTYLNAKCPKTPRTSQWNHYGSKPKMAAEFLKLEQEQEPRHRLEAHEATTTTFWTAMGEHAITITPLADGPAYYVLHPQKVLPFAFFLTYQASKNQEGIISRKILTEGLQI